MAAWLTVCTGTTTLSEETFMHFTNTHTVAHRSKQSTRRCSNRFAKLVLGTAIVASVGLSSTAAFADEAIPTTPTVEGSRLRATPR